MPTTTACHAMKPAPAVKSIEAIFISSADRRDVMGRQRPECRRWCCPASR
jgi:hypothetical protein